MSEKEVTLNIRINEELRQVFKECAVRNKETMSGVIKKAIKEYVDENSD